jgi:hypothetical protein
MRRSDQDEFSVGTIDRSRPFVPAHLTPLAHTPTFATLAPDVRLRYNQLFASCYHEHFIFLEWMLAEHTLPALIPDYAGLPMADRLGEFRDDERKHTAWFHALHRACEPSLYDGNYHHFVRVAAGPLRLFRAVARRPGASRFAFGSR